MFEIPIGCIRLGNRGRVHRKIMGRTWSGFQSLRNWSREQRIGGNNDLQRIFAFRTWQSLTDKVCMPHYNLARAIGASQSKRLQEWNDPLSVK
jgi:hypothetical protein